MKKDPVLPTPRKLGAVPWTGPDWVIVGSPSYRPVTVPP
jgi:hypothetical protein